MPARDNPWAVYDVFTAPDGERAGQTVKTTLFPITLAHRRFGVRLQPPRKGEHTRALLTELSLAAQEIDELVRQGAVA